MPHMLALLGSASLMQSTACSGEHDAEVPAGEGRMTTELTAQSV